MAIRTKDKAKHKPAWLIKLEEHVSINRERLKIINGDSLGTKCCGVPPILYLGGNASCPACEAYFHVAGNLTYDYPKLVSRSGLDQSAQRKGIDYSPSVIRSVREAKAPPARDLFTGQQELFA